MNQSNPRTYSGSRKIKVKYLLVTRECSIKGLKNLRSSFYNERWDEISRCIRTAAFLKSALGDLIDIELYQLTRDEVLLRWCLNRVNLNLDDYTLLKRVKYGTVKIGLSLIDILNMFRREDFECYALIEQGNFYKEALRRHDKMLVILGGPRDFIEFDEKILLNSTKTISLGLKSYFANQCIAIFTYLVQEVVCNDR